MSEAALCWPAFRFHHKSEIWLKPPRKVQGSVSTTPMMVVTWDNLLAFLSQCQQSIYNFNLKPDVNGWFCTVLTQVLTFTESIQSSKSEFSKGRERAQNPKSISFKLSFSKLSLTSNWSAWHIPPKVELSSYPAQWWEVAWNGRGKARSWSLGVSVLVTPLQLICDMSLSDLPDILVLKLVFGLMSLLQRRACSSLLTSLKFTSWSFRKVLGTIKRDFVDHDWKNLFPFLGFAVSNQNVFSGIILAEWRFQSWLWAPLP